MCLRVQVARTRSYAVLMQLASLASHRGFAPRTACPPFRVSAAARRVLGAARSLRRTSCGSAARASGPTTPATTARAASE
eukprot:207976-Pleurochrysis_carterae.AAC.1